jgi:exopolysaccharide biosynthesis predicted pyruvyltransferase EpsI
MKGEKKILYYNNCWFTNVGEAFIDIGAMQLLRKLFPNSKIACVSDMTNYYFNELSRKKGNLLLYRKENEEIISNYFNKLECDYIVLAGMFATDLYLNTLGRRMVDSFLKKGSKVIFLGLGGCEYNESEKKKFGKYLDQIAPFFVMTRDEDTYNNYKDICECVKGIDCAFWIDEVFNPKGFASNIYDVVTFNRLEEPKIKIEDAEIVRPCHMQNSFSEKDIKNGLFISDTPYDYLTLYANARKVYTDLVHAGIVSLMYEVPVKYWYVDQRCRAFDALDGIEHKEDWMTIKHEKLILQRKNVEEIITNKIM